ncbi:proton channel OtopLc-like [Argiope bruennichi]|uniref:Proton channel OtopLc like protein n=1 Tax=Argiope bruennichi TaxID=94029 RepID=A0A8T0FLF5_ARGBR|nr:proton channel OtopLc-like [Argiope bruennichi]KAF8790220.1 Proton channel OtopLc like protein [Argiope bruennichi]
MATQETELTPGNDARNDQNNIFNLDPRVTYENNHDGDDNSVKDMSTDSSSNDSTLHALSGLYAQIILVVAAILVFTELLHGPVPVFFFHGYLFTYLVGGGIICFLGAYVNMLMNKCPRWSESGYNGARAVFSTKFVKNLFFSDISIYLRIGSVVFGLGTLISSGLEVAAIFTGPKKCMDDLNMMQPVLRCLFSFIQMHFLFMNTKDMVNSFRWFRHFALMHLVATNLAIWIRIMLWESTRDWLDAIHYKHNSSIPWIDAKFNVSKHSLDSDTKHQDHARHKPHHRVHIAVARHCIWESYDHHAETEGLMEFHLCMQNSTIGDIWEKAMPYLYPFLVQYCLVATAIIYITWSNLHSHRLKMQRFAAVSVYGKTPNQHDEVNCGGSTRGLFLGLLILVAGIIAIILFFVLAQDKDFNVHFMIGALECGIFGISTLATILGIVQIRKMKSKTSRQRRLSELLQRIGMLAVYVYGICNMIAGSVSMGRLPNFLLFLDGTLMVVQAFLQSLFIHQVAKKRLSPLNIDEKPGREVVIFLVFINIVLWILESFTTQKQLRSGLQQEFYGDIAWPVITRIVLPFVIFYRFHSAVALMEAWRKSYRVKQN